ncbi:MAG: FtsW/RodA/SpoVE family cell cycle protein [Flammeovirgaceae bacterium]|jgi:cell division protein FtsW|nr:FtsW/RodA/SpoVE family cell cycle protein [Flammeovirgaceae bacterium]|tara:strand:+ start:22448 stop:23611 length:1164 start_codon:yes stop_codon:yes gene_type:complete
MTAIKEWAYRNLKGDSLIWSIVLLLSIFSILVVYSATGSLAYKYVGGNTEYYLMKHGALVLLSLFAMWLVHRIDYRYYSKVSKLLLYVSAVLLVVTWQFGSNINEASRWLSIPIINQAFQPSDLAKLALIVTLANMLAKRQHNIADFQKAIVPMLIWIGVICGLIAMTNISSALMLFGTCMVVLFIGRVPVKFIAMLIFIGGISGILAISFGQRGGTAKSRIESYFGDEIPYQAQQAYAAIATGGLFGKGPGQSDQRNFLPSAYSDFIYAIIIEEYGLIGGLSVLMLYLGLLYRGMKATTNSDTAYGGLLASGLVFSIIFQAMINIGVTLGVGPITGVTLPLLSMGGTSQLFFGIALGMILSVTQGQLEGDTLGNRNQTKKPQFNAL